MDGAKRLPPFAAKKEQQWKRYSGDSFLALGSILLLTGIISLFHLYELIPDSLLLYLPIVLALASMRGLYAALLASFIAFFLFDFLYVSPVYSLIITKFADVIALVVFLIAAITTSQLASALRKRAEEANRRERETHILYDLVHATNREEDMEHQLSIFASSVVEVFSPWGIYNCVVLLPDVYGKLAPLAERNSMHGKRVLSACEEEAAAQAMSQACTIDVYDDSHICRISAYDTRSGMTSRAKSKRYTRLIPLKTDSKVAGVLCLFVEDSSQYLSTEYTARVEHEWPTPQSVFFSTFLEQAIAVIERGHLRRESLHNKVLQQTDALRAALLSSVSHDLRTPLTTIKTAASSLLQKDVQLDEEVRNTFAQAIERESDRLNRLVENLLDMSRIEGGALHPMKVWYPLDEIIYNVLGRMQPFLEGRTIKKYIPDNLPPVKIDYVQIGQVVTNLLENASRYTPIGSPIDVSIQALGEHIQVSLADRGPGVSTVDRERIFDKFYRVHREPHAADHDRGSGLGLAVCRGIVEAHNGRIWVETREGGGAIFCFTLPKGSTEGA